METELIRVWQLVSELSEQLTRNQELATSLKNQAVVLKVSISYPITQSSCDFSDRTERTNRALVFLCAGSTLIYPRVPCPHANSCSSDLIQNNRGI